ncbi:MAG TPA: serine/threonine-protein kinase [Candidatus Krumholzibacteria bacterium]|nr:serine/threonine-protein kinase [Candidatus Krumholzibacteria bacterium]
MDDGRWQRVEALFHEALERPEEERDAFLRAACAGDEALYNEVRALLDADDAPHSLLDGRAIDVIEPGPGAALPEGTRVGPYRVLRSIGTGGMGVVYLAERADGQFEQRVALKLIKRGMDSATILARFHAERRILARLQHPNIARLLDGGMAEDGLPFFTLEYVDGQPITDYCDERRLPIEDRLDLFQAVCAAVQYAHGNLVVHRDLKPNNILVTHDGHVKLLDFGIARVLGEDEEGLTRSGQRVMTPAYASPEQVRGEPVTTATDVYSLGVVLYELLCGRHPHRDTTSTPAELERAIADTPAERPSRFLSRIDTVGTAPAVRSPEDVARARRLAPARLHRRLQGDLDNICLVALRKEPERRYASASQLLEDIRLHLSGRPVSARPDTFRYRYGKFVRRNRAGIAAATSLVVVVAAITVLYTTRLARERDRARQEATKAATVSEFVTGLFEAADPYTSRGEAITARELLDKGRDRVRAELADQPDVLADMLRTIGNAYGNLGIIDEAVALLKESRALRIATVGEHDAEAVRTTVRLMEYLVIAGAYAEADSFGRRAVAVGRTLEDRKALADALGSLGQCVNMQGLYEEAEPLYREAIVLFHEIEGPGSVAATPVMNNFGLLMHEQSRYAEADSLFKRALEVQEAVWGKRHPETATTRYNYAQLLADEGHLSEARAMWDEVLATDRELFPAGHPSIAFTLSAYGRLLSNLGEFEEAAALQREALEIRRNNHGAEHPDVAYSLGSLGRALHDNGYYDEAERTLREAYDMHVRVNGPRHPVLVNLKNGIGLIQYDRGDYAAADTSFARALALLNSLRNDAEHHQKSVALVRRAAVLAATGRLTDAEAAAREGVAVVERLHEDQAMGIATAKIKLANILLQSGSVAEAESLYAEGLARMRALEAGAPVRPRDCDALIGLGRCRLAAGDIAGAEALAREALAIHREYFRPGHPTTARTRIALAEVLVANGRAAEAKALLREAIDPLTPLVLPRQIDLVAAQRMLLASPAGSR